MFECDNPPILAHICDESGMDREVVEESCRRLTFMGFAKESLHNGFTHYEAQDSAERLFLSDESDQV